MALWGSGVRIPSAPPSFLFVRGAPGSPELALPKLLILFSGFFGALCQQTFHFSFHVIADADLGESSIAVD